MLRHTAYNYRVEIISLIARILLTIAIEMLLALLLGFRKKKQLLLLAGVNTATQIILIVFALEAVVYCTWMNRFAEKTRKKRV